ncbi:MAG: hypothetical protein GJ680_07475 [Alteromonadaceae bacterium]|nr:hypothetical protein [Alteromonadaceae bacterium]
MLDLIFLWALFGISFLSALVYVNTHEANLEEASCFWSVIPSILTFVWLYQLYDVSVFDWLSMLFPHSSAGSLYFLTGITYVALLVTWVFFPFGSAYALKLARELGAPSPTETQAQASVEH